MATQFDATARINVDLRGFSQAANEVTRSGGTMTRVFQNLHQQMNQLEAVNKKTAADLQRTASVYTAIARAAQQYASAIQALSRNETSGAAGAQKMAQAFAALRNSLASVQGLSAKESDRLGRTVNLYNQLASALQKVARAYQIIRSVGQADAQMAQAAQRNAQAAARLAVEQQRVEAATLRAANAQRRLNAELNGASNSMGRFGQSTFAIRSSLGEIESQGQQLLRILQQIGTAIGGSAISQEKAFAQVSRVVGEANAESNDLLGSFRQIAEEFPISFEQVARIGQLGAQIGIGADELDAFTRTVAAFSLTTGVAAEQTTLLLGRIAEMQDVPTSQLENLGSAILDLGTKSAATEDEILRINESIATVSNVFGLSAQAVTGLAASLATLRVRPELARGSLTRVFGEMDAAISEGGEGLQQFSSLMGMTSEEVIKLRKSNPDEFFLAFVRGLSEAGTESGNFQQILRDLGINAVRDIDTFTRLANNFDVVEKSFSDSNKAWADGTELQRQFQGIADTTAAKLQNLKDAFVNLLATGGEPLLPVISKLADMFTFLIDKATGMGVIVPIFGALVVAVVAGSAAWVAYRVVIAKTIQSLLAMRELQTSLQGRTLNLATAIAVYRGQLNGVAATTTAAATATGRLAASNTAAATSFANMGRSAAAVAASMTASTTAMAGVTASTRNVALSAAQLSASNTLAARSAATMNTNMSLSLPIITNMTGAMQRAAIVGNSMGAGMIAASGATAGLSRQLAATGAAGTVAAAGMTTASRASRILMASLGPITLVLTAATLAWSFFGSSAEDAVDRVEEASDGAWNAAGGIETLTKALEEDTAAWAAHGKPIDTAGDGLTAYTATAGQMSGEIKKSRQDLNDTADSFERQAKAAYGSVAAMRAQAKQGGAAGAAAAELAKQYDAAAKAAAKANKEAAGGNTVIFGEKAAKKTQEALQKAVQAADFTKSNKSMERFVDTGIKLGDVMADIGRGDIKAALGGFTKPLQEAQKEVDRLQVKFDDSNRNFAAAQEEPGLVGAAREERETAQQRLNDAKKTREELLTLQEVVRKGDTESRRLARAQDVLAEATGRAGDAASASGDDISAQAQAMEDLANAASELAGNLNSAFGPLSAWNAAAEAAAAGTDNLTEAQKAAAVSMGSLLEEMRKQAKAQQEWAANLTTVASRVPRDVANELAAMGPEAAGMIQKLATASDKELKEYVELFRQTGENGSSELATGLLNALPELSGAGKRVGDAAAKSMDEAISSGDITGGIDKIKKQLETLGKITTKNPKIDLDDAPARLTLDQLVLWAQAKQLQIKPSILFDQAKTTADFNRIANIIQTVAAAKKAKINIDIDDAPAKLTLTELEAWVKAQEISGLLDAKGKAVMEDSAFRAKVIGLADLVLGKKAAGEFDVNGNGKFSDKEFRALFEALMEFISSNKSKFDVTGTANLNDNITPKVGGIIQALNGLNGKTSTAYANVVHTTYRKEIDQGNRGSVEVATGGYISGPGGPRDDRIAAWLSNGEYVVNADATAQHRALLDSINAKGSRASRSQPYRYAGGGLVQQDRKSAMIMAQAAGSVARASSAITQLSRTADRRVSLPRVNSGPVITVNNTYPREEPTSITINRSLAYAAALNGTL